jgi:hypothetical protein
MSKPNEVDGFVPAPKPAYEAPAIEEIMTPSELEREVHYAGEPTGPNNP